MTVASWLLVGCAGSQGFGSGAPGSQTKAVLPDNVRIVSPRADLDPRKAKFSGTWSGVWIGLGDRLPHTLVVETISEETFSAVYATGDSLGPGMNLTGRWWRIYGTVESGKMSARLPASNATVVYSLNADGTVSGTFTNGRGFSSKATLTKER